MKWGAEWRDTATHREVFELGGQRQSEGHVGARTDRQVELGP